MDNKLKVFKREEKNAEFRLKQNLSMGEARFNQFIWQRTQLAVAADNFLRERNLAPVLQTTLSKDMEEQLKLVHKVIDVVDWCDTAEIQGGQPRIFLFSSSSIRTEEGRKVSANCVCQL